MEFFELSFFDNSLMNFGSSSVKCDRLYPENNFAEVFMLSYFSTVDCATILPSRHGYISDASLRCLIQRLRDVSKRPDLQIPETSPGRFIKDVSSETSLRSLRLSQRRL